MFSRFGVPEEISSDAGPEFTSSATREFLKTWDVTHWIAIAYYPRSSNRAEVTVKHAKRLLRLNVEAPASPHNDKFLSAMLYLLNTADSDCQVSPAEIIFGCQLRDSFSVLNMLDELSNPNFLPTWRKACKLKYEAWRTRFVRNSETLNQRAKEFRPLYVGSRCLLQNKSGTHLRKWDSSGVVMEMLPHDHNICSHNRSFTETYS